MQTLELKVPPVFVVLGVGALMSFGSKMLPTWTFSLPGGSLLVWVCGVVGFAVSAAGVTAFGRVGTTADPRVPEEASTLVQGGAYRYSRNPMYVGMGVALLAWALHLRSWAALIGIPVFIIYMTRFQIVPEERVLTEKFGDVYVRYKEEVRRWL